jgi:hypothetical protein
VLQIFPVYTESAVRNRLEITASVIIANEFYPSLQRLLTEQLAQIHKRTNKTAGDFVAGPFFLCACIKSIQSLNYPINSDLSRRRPES